MTTNSRWKIVRFAIGENLVLYYPVHVFDLSLAIESWLTGDNGMTGRTAQKSNGARFRFALIFPLLLLSAEYFGAAAQESILTYDPSTITADGPENCAECHERTSEAWSESTHSRTYEELHLREEAQEILERLGESGSIRRNSECVQCHYTRHARESGGRAKTISGISCQRCHGGARDWIVIHQDTEQYPDRMERLMTATENGMRSTLKIYDLARNCFQCHTVPRENLVNVGEHPAGSEMFELVAYLQGEVRHNFLPTPAEETNKPASTERKRLLYVIGKSIDLEFSLRSLALATVDGIFLESMMARVQKAYDDLKLMGLNVAEINAMLDTIPKEGDTLKLVKNNKEEYENAADTISSLATFLEEKSVEYGAALAPIDSSLPAEFKGEVYK
ncbi:MAG TPA: hypothetical protein EYN96_09305 [Candidatus Hydrogenedentes bacterium]|nr:hypothetical protein [Candidatus Hydrogenedentota bacterium]